MKKSPLVSVIMPCKNSKLTLKQAILSCVNQTFTDWELLIIDDGSTDGSVHIAEEFCLKDGRIRLFKNEKPSGFPASPRNVGIKEAKGRFIAFLDSDDEWFLTKLEKQIPLFSNENVAVVFSFYCKMSEKGVPRDSLVRSPCVVSFSDLLKSNSVGNLTGIYDTEKVGKVFQKEIWHEDYLMYLEILKKGFIALNTLTCEAFYRVSKNSISSSKIKASIWHWRVLRCELHLPLFHSLRFFSFYIIFSFLKFIR